LNAALVERRHGSLSGQFAARLGQVDPHFWPSSSAVKVVRQLLAGWGAIDIVLAK